MTPEERKPMFEPEQVMQELVKISVALGVARARNEALERALITTATALDEIISAWERGASGETVRALGKAAVAQITAALAPPPKEPDA